MSSFNDTIDLERAFLKAITTSAIMTRMYLHQAKEEMFTSDPRQTIFSLAEIALNESNCLLNKQIFEYELKARFADEHIANCMCEWAIIDGITSYDAPEAILAKLKEADMGRKTLKVSEDVIDLLTKGNIKDAIAFLKREAMLIGGGSKDDRPLMRLTDIEARLQLIRDKQQHPERYQGLKTGLKTFDEQTGGLFPGELTLVAGITGLGKSTLCRTIAKGLVTLNGCRNVLHVANEEYLEQVQYKYDALYTGIPYQDFKFANISDADLDRWQKFMQKDMEEAGRGQVFIKEVPAFTDVSLVEQQYRILENRGIQIHAIIIDHLPHVKPIQQAWGENDERSKAAADCKELARQLKLPVITPTQAATEVEKKTAQGKRAGKMDVYGSKGQVHVANTFLIITYKGTDDTQVDIPDYLRDVYWLCDAKKNRDGAPFYFMAKHMVKTGTVIEIDDPSTKPTKAANKAVTEALKEAEKETKPTTVPATPVVTKAHPELNTGIRDASMEFAEVIEGNGDENLPEVTSLEDQAIADALKEVEVQKPVEEAQIEEQQTAIPAKVILEQGRLALAAEAAEKKKSVLGQIRGKNIPENGL